MQVLVLAVQNAVGYGDLGAATSGATFFRSIGAAFGVSIFGTIFSNLLRDKLSAALAGHRLPPGFSANSASADPRAVRALPPALRGGVLHAYSQSITEVFLYAVPVCAVAFVLSWFLKEQPLRGAVSVPDASEVVGSNPVDRTSLEEVARGISVLGSREGRRDLYVRITELSGVDLHPASAWLLLRIHRTGPADPMALGQRTTVPREIVQRAADEVRGKGLARPDEGGNALVLTDRGQEVTALLAEARRRVLRDLLGDWGVEAEKHADLSALLTGLSQEFCGGDHDRPEHPRGSRRAQIDSASA
jgi:hypothetical protein